MTQEEKNFYKERNRKFMLRYAPDIDAFEGLYFMFELYFLDNEFQIRELKRLKRGDYTRANPEAIKHRKTVNKYAKVKRTKGKV